MSESESTPENASPTQETAEAPKKKSWVKRILLVLLVGFVALQLIPVDRSNPPVTGDLVAPPEVKAILKASCYDCHSNETHWPWYSYINPMGMLIAHHVEEGRELLNFSEWENWDEDEQYNQKENIYSFCSPEEEPETPMPPPDYVILHPGAELTAEEFKILDCWMFPEYCEEETEEEDSEDSPEQETTEAE